MADEPIRTLAPKIDDEFAAIFSKLSEEETKILRQKIQREGMTQPLIVWGDPKDPKHLPNILLDGHNRLGICRELQVKYQVRYIQFKDSKGQPLPDDAQRVEAERWIYLNQLGRRNLSPDRATYFLGKYWNSVKGAKGGRPKETSAKDAEVSPTDGKLTAKEVAAQAGVSERTVHNAGKYAETVDALPAEEKEKVLAGKGPSRAEVVQGMAWRQTPIKDVIPHPASNIVFAAMELKTVGQVYDALINKSIPTVTGDVCPGIPETAQGHLLKDLERFIRDSTAEPAKSPRKPKTDNGAVDMNWNAWHAAWGQTVRTLDTFFKAHSLQNGEAHQDMLTMCSQVQQEFRDHYARITGKEAPPISGGTSGQA